MIINGILMDGWLNANEVYDALRIKRSRLREIPNVRTREIDNGTGSVMFQYWGPDILREEKGVEI